MEYIHLSMFSHISKEMALLFAALNQVITTTLVILRISFTFDYVLVINFRVVNINNEMLSLCQSSCGIKIAFLQEKIVTVTTDANFIPTCNHKQNIVLI